MTDWSKLGRNNKDRGKAFERKVADMLGMTRVPYSGSHRTWGKGDVFDGTLFHGYWLIECKTQPASESGRYLIKDTWIRQAAEAVEGTNRNWLVATQMYGHSEAWVFIPASAWQFVNMRVDFSETAIASIGVTMTGTRGRGFTFNPNAYDKADIYKITTLRKSTGESDIWHAIRLKDLRVLLQQVPGLMVPRPEAQAG